MLRHATGYALANDRRTDTRLIQDFLGHASIANTVRYTRLAPGRLVAEHLAATTRSMRCTRENSLDGYRQSRALGNDASQSIAAGRQAPSQPRVPSSSGLFPECIARSQPFIAGRDSGVRRLHARPEVSKKRPGGRPRFPASPVCEVSGAERTTKIAGLAAVLFFPGPDLSGCVGSWHFRPAALSRPPRSFTDNALRAMRDTGASSSRRSGVGRAAYSPAPRATLRTAGPSDMQEAAGHARCTEQAGCSRATAEALPGFGGSIRNRDRRYRLPHARRQCRLTARKCTNSPRETGHAIICHVE
jgi:hypothetical protein